MTSQEIARCLYSRAVRLVADAIAKPTDTGLADEALAVCDRLGGLYADQLDEKQRRTIRRLLKQLAAVVQP